MQETEASTIAHSLKIPHLIARLLVKRGVKTSVEASRMIFSKKSCEQDSFLIYDMHRAVDWVLKIKESKESIFIFGDYDLDGISSVALLTRGFKEIGIESYWRLPNRFTSGYGISIAAIDEMIEAGAKNLITVDTGITSIEELSYARSQGLKVMVVDHHKPSGDALPICDVLLDPHQEKDTYRNEDLCGVGLSYKLIDALFKTLDIKGVEKYLDLVALGTLADLVPMTEENRSLTSCGLKQMSKTQWYGVKELCRSILQFKPYVSGQDVLFQIAPILNAPGRIGAADKSLKLLLANSSTEAIRLLAELKKKNKKRKEMEAVISKAAIEWVNEKYGENLPAILVVDGVDWHIGVIGIVAAKVSQEFNRPTAILSNQGDGTAYASARSILGFNWHQALYYSRDLFIRWGGHFSAAGFALYTDQIDILRDRLEEFAVQENFEPHQVKKEITYDIEVALSEIDENLMDYMHLLEPMGGAFPYPVFKATKLKVHKLRVLKNAHLQMEVSQNGSPHFGAIAFGMFPLKQKIEQNNYEITLYFEVVWNVYNRQKNIQLAVKAIEF